jgi:conjugative relaxase-like TrwC/TraI family protein
MMNASDPITASQMVHYHKQEFANSKDNYYTEGGEIIGTYGGSQADAWGLAGEVTDVTFKRLAEGQHPLTGEQLVRHQKSRTSTNAKGDKVVTREHRAGWDFTFSAPKSISLTALVGGDAAVRAVHVAAVTKALDAIEKYAQARVPRTKEEMAAEPDKKRGGNRPETTGRLVTARFEHDSARPVNGYAAPQVHTHVIVFNVTVTDEGKARPLQPRQLFKSQRYATRVYRKALWEGLEALSYRVVRAEKGEPQIAGYTKEYLEAASPRSQQIKKRLAEINQTGAEAAQLAAAQTREKKVDLSKADVLRAHRVMAAQFGHQPDHVVQEAVARGTVTAPRGISPDAAVTYARDVTMERNAVSDERAILSEALDRSTGSRATGEESHQAFAAAIGRGVFINVPQNAGNPALHYTTPAMQALERDNIAIMRDGQGQRSPLADADIRRDLDAYDLSDHQRAVAAEVLANRDVVSALDGKAGVGKTTTLAPIVDAMERQGYQVLGLAPTSRATQLLVDAGCPVSTLQGYLIRPLPDQHPKTVFVLDESSLASTVQVHDLLNALGQKDRVLLVGDTRQHKAVDAGTPFAQLVEAGIATAHLTEIIRQREVPELLEVVEHLSEGRVPHAMSLLEAQGRVHELPHRGDRYRAIAADFMTEPDGTLIVSPDNQSRTEINGVLHRALQGSGAVSAHDYTLTVLVARQSLTGAERAWAANYDVGDVVRFAKGSETRQIPAGTYGRVLATDAEGNANTLRVHLDDGRTITYDSRRLQGVTVYREEERQFADGDRIQLTAPVTEGHQTLAVNRQLGHITGIGDGRLNLTLETGRVIAIRTNQPLHLDHGYAVTSHSSQGQTSNRVLAHIDTHDKVGTTFANMKLAYVSMSRSRYDIQVYTDDREKLPTVLSREVKQQTALEAERPQQAPVLGHSLVA